jgi:hypothetical protein
LGTKNLRTTFQTLPNLAKLLLDLFQTVAHATDFVTRAPMCIAQLCELLLQIPI